ncbi:hypothetical protein AS593_00560 [Caulobacter vibrioides]|nr:hypothetical protein AS593_00560 [Caulobacter vibrioides]
MVSGRGDIGFEGGKTLFVHGALAAGLLAALTLAQTPAAAYAAETPAGATIANTAHVSYRDGTATVSSASNPVTTSVAELIDFSVRYLRVVRLSARSEALAFRLANLGNSRRAFALSVEGAAASRCKIYLDPTGRETFEPANVTLYDPARPPELDPGASIQVWTVCEGDGSAVGQVDLKAWPVSKPGDGQAAWARQTSVASGEVSQPSAVAASLAKSQSVTDRKGRARAVAGSTITYTLAASIQGRGVAQAVTVSDPIPAGATYVAGSLRLDGQALTDQSGDDAGELAGGAVSVRLGDVVAPAQRVVTFQVVINP